MVEGDLVVLAGTTATDGVVLGPRENADAAEAAVDAQPLDDVVVGGYLEAVERRYGRSAAIDRD
jgi:hypothetical protein